MAALQRPGRAQALRRRRGAEGHRPHRRERRVRRAARPVGLRQVHAAQRRRRPRARRAPARSRSAIAWSTTSSRKDRDIAMVFQSYALYPAMTVRGNITFGMECRGVPKQQQSEAVARVARAAADRRAARAQAGAALGRPAPARRHGPRAGARSAAVPVRRAAQQPRRQAARRHAHRDQAAPPAHRHHDRLRHARPDRGDDDGEPHRRHGPRRDQQQFDSPETVYNRPANLFVARFLGTPPMNTVPARLARHGDSLAAIVGAGQR